MTSRRPSRTRECLPRAASSPGATSRPSRKGLAKIAREVAAGTFAWSLDAEDVHLNIEKRLTALVGEAGKRLHTARSRNDQVATDLRLWLRDEIDAVRKLLAALERALLAPGGEACRARHAGLHPPAGRRSRSPSATTCSPISRCWNATANVYLNAEKE